MTWLLVIAIGAATYVLRASFLVSPRSAALSRLDGTLRYVPVAVLPALATSAVVNNAGGHLDVRIAAALAGAVIAWRTRSVALTMVTGMAVLWALTYLT